MTIFESARQVLGQGDTAQALRHLISYLENTKLAPEALRSLQVLEANYNSTRQKEIKGILNFSEVQQTNNKINDAILGLLEDLEAGRTVGLTLEKSPMKSPLIYWLIGGIIILLLGLIAGVLLRDTPPEKPDETAACPAFNLPGVPILLIPFQSLGDPKAKPELAIQTRIRDLTAENNMPSDVQLYQGKQFDNNTPGSAEALQLANDCKAKMVIWGQYEKIAEGISVDVRYVFSDKPNMPAGAFSETLRNLTQLRADSSTFNTLDDAIFSLCTVLALHEGRMDLAKKWLEKVEHLSPMGQKLKGIMGKNE